ncbi:MAG: UDP-N-acetylmuramate:L-alanyl-gamma-D-glutamyl-meso-diaminopimelate ligase [Proteobacteria bacterium]|nr:UDP-N-acetylmuramate:L-alanyl-gamma-D-glutamyl-meso-diaminopimelate ligase [Pseudomonadota bacterium]
MNQQVRHIHMVAICGIGMGSLAGLLKSAGYHVTGSDENVYPPMSHQLADLQIPVSIGFNAANLEPRPDLVIIGNAAKPGNPEVEAVLAQGLPHMSFPEALAEYFICDRESLVVTGTHGKTTSTSMLSWVLESAGRSPSFMVGGVAKNFEKSFKTGEGRHFVVEGDEYQTAFFHKVPKFHYYRAKMAVINSMEFDHGDIFTDLAHIQETFRTHLIDRLPADGFLAVCTDYPAVKPLLTNVPCAVETYGLKTGASWLASDIVIGEEGTSFTVTHEGKLFGRFLLPMAGRHNVQNALGVIAICNRIGLGSDEIATGLASYEGVKRRQEIRGVVDDIIVMDDFAHHPTKVRETVKAVKARYPRRTVWAVWEPRTASSRRDFFQKDYVKSFDAADRVVVADVFLPEAIEPDRLFSSHRLVDDLVAAGKKAGFYPDADAIVEMMRREAQPGDVVLVMSNGAFGNIHDKLLRAFDERLSGEIAPVEDSGVHQTAREAVATQVSMKAEQADTEFRAPVLTLRAAPQPAV